MERVVQTLFIANIINFDDQPIANFRSLFFEIYVLKSILVAFSVIAGALTGFWSFTSKLSVHCTVRKGLFAGNEPDSCVEF